MTFTYKTYLLNKGPGQVPERHPDSGSREEDGPRCHREIHLLQSTGPR